MKKAIAAILSVVVLLSTFAGCSNVNRNQQTGSSVSSTPDISPIPEAPSTPEPAPMPESTPDHLPSVEDILDSIRSNFGDEYPPNGEIPAEMLEAEFGLTPDLYEEALGEMSMISAHNDRVVVAKAKPDQADEVERVLEEARQRKIEDTLQYPANVPKTNASKVVRHGDYVAFLLVGVPLENPEVTEAELREHAESETKRAVEGFESAFIA